MEYRQFPRGKENETFSVIGLGLGGIVTTASPAPQGSTSAL